MIQRHRSFSACFRCAKITLFLPSFFFPPAADFFLMSALGSPHEFFSPLRMLRSLLPHAPSYHSLVQTRSFSLSSSTPGLPEIIRSSTPRWISLCPVFQALRVIWSVSPRNASTGVLGFFSPHRLSPLLYRRIEFWNVHILFAWAFGSQLSHGLTQVLSFPIV